MRKVILYIAASLDSYIARKDGSIDWLTTYNSESEDYGYNDFYPGVDVLLMGKKTYDQVIGFSQWPYEDKQVIVFSKESVLDPRVKAVPEPVAYTKALKEQQGKNIWLVGGGQIISLFLTHGLIDEIILTVTPVILGSGIPLFPGVTSDIELKLLGEKPFPSGLVQVHYAMGG